MKKILAFWERLKVMADEDGLPRNEQRTVRHNENDVRCDEQSCQLPKPPVPAFDSRILRQHHGTPVDAISSATGMNTLATVFPVSVTSPHDTSESSLFVVPTELWTPSPHVYPTSPSPSMQEFHSVAAMTNAATQQQFAYPPSPTYQNRHLPQQSFFFSSSILPAHTLPLHTEYNDQNSADPLDDDMRKGLPRKAVTATKTPVLTGSSSASSIVSSSMASLKLPLGSPSSSSSNSSISSLSPTCSDFNSQAAVVPCSSPSPLSQVPNVIDLTKTSPVTSSSSRITRSMAKQLANSEDSDEMFAKQLQAEENAKFQEWQSRRMTQSKIKNRETSIRSTFSTLGSLTSLLGISADSTQASARKSFVSSSSSLSRTNDTEEDALDDYDHNVYDLSFKPMSTSPLKSLDDLELLPAPVDASPDTSKTIIQDLRLLLRKCEKPKPGEDLGFEVDRSSLDNLYQWKVFLKNFDPSLPLSKDMKKRRLDSITLEVRFGPDYPQTPPYVRVIYPRLVRFMHGGGGHVTAGGSICMDLLTSSGWSSLYRMEAVLLQVKMALSSLEPFPARIDPHHWNIPYNKSEAIHAYIRVARDHGWRLPSWTSSVLQDSGL